MTNGAEIPGPKIKAAVVRDEGGRFSAESLTLDGPRRDEVLAKIVATGMCHTDMVARGKVYDVPHPIVLGHEGAGLVESVGANLRRVAPGDPVVLTSMPCGIEALLPAPSVLRRERLPHE